MKDFVLEAICSDNPASGVDAEAGGATRLELCANLVIGGTSPSVALFETVRSAVDIPIRVLLRPRFGDFCYDEYEFDILKEEVETFRELGADGVVIGVLTPDGSLDIPRMRELIDVSGAMDVTLHRAFDMAADQMKTMEEAIDLGIKTILTSGAQDSAWAGRDLLKELQERARGRIEILAGGGIDAGSIEKLYPHTGITSYHMSGKSVKDSRMTYRSQNVHMGFGGMSEYDIWMTSEEKVAAARAAIEKL